MTHPITLDDLLATISGKAITEQPQIEKQASTPTAVSSASELEQLLTKSANVNPSMKTNEDEIAMNKQAQEAGKALADVLLANLLKQANAVAEDSTQMVAEQVAQQAPTPREGFSITDTLKGLLLRGVQNGGATNEVSEMVGPDIAAGQGAVVGVTPTAPAAMPNGYALGSVGEGEYMNDEHEKAAAVYALCQHGWDFDSAYARVKQAEEEIASDTIEMAKVAAVNELMAHGVDMMSAVNYIQGSAADLGL